MKPQIKAVCILLVIGSSLSLPSCTPQKEDPTPSTVKQSDQAGASAVDGSLDDVNDIVSNNIGGGSTQAAGGRMAAYNLPCGIVSLDSSKNENGKKVYALKYGKETKCGYKKKSGTVSFQLVNGTRFNEKNAQYKITYTAYTVEVEATGDVVVVDGSFYVTNVEGGYIWESVVKNATIKHKVRGMYTVTYANGQARQRKYYQLRTWASANQWAGLTFTVSGDTTIAGVKISEIGKTLDGNYDYQTQILTDYQWSNCGTTYAGPYVLKKGLAKVNITVPGVTPAYFQVEAGYTFASANTPVKVEDCTANAYKINVVIGSTASTQYQLY